MLATFFLLAQNVIVLAQVSQFCLPLRNLKVTSGFGLRVHPVTGQPDFHKGVDLAAKSESVFAIINGNAIVVGKNAILGNYIKLSSDSILYIYGHLSSLFIRQGDTVATGQVIALSGATGRTTGEHLHLSIKLGNTYLDPLRFLAELAKVPD